MGQREGEAQGFAATRPGIGRQAPVNPPESWAKKFCVGPLKLFPGLQIFSASPSRDRDATRVPPLETGTGRVRCRS